MATLTNGWELRTDNKMIRYPTIALIARAQKLMLSQLRLQRREDATKHRKLRKAGLADKVFTYETPSMYYVYYYTQPISTASTGKAILARYRLAHSFASCCYKLGVGAAYCERSQIQMSNEK